MSQSERDKKAFAVAWSRETARDGSVYFTPEKHWKQKIVIAGPGDRDPLPHEIAEAIRLLPQGDVIANGRLVVEERREQVSRDGGDLPSGCYSFEAEAYPLPERLVPIQIRDDSYLKLPGLYDELVGDIRTFLASESIYRDLGFQYRRGLLLYGPPGNGKTSLIRELIHSELPKEAVVFHFTTLPSRSFLRAIKSSLASRLKVVVFEELAAVVKDSNVDSVLSFLDGEESLDRCLVIATTNYPSRLPGNLVDRPSRFDRLYKFGEPDEESRRALLSRYLGRTISELEIEATKGLSAAALREVSLLVRMSGKTVQSAAKALQKHKSLVQREFGEIGIVGFKSRDDD